MICHTKIDVYTSRVGCVCDMVENIHTHTHTHTQTQTDTHRDTLTQINQNPHEFIISAIEKC